MRQWNLPYIDPAFALPLAADARVTAVSYTDDQIWELNVGGGDPQAVALRTTYGLRARAMRLFPRFYENDHAISSPYEFYRTPVLRSFHPSYARLEFAPFSGIDVAAEYWVPQSRAILCRLQFSNQSDTPRQITLEWVSILTPTEGQRMASQEIQACHVLCGQTGALFPVVFLTGGAQATLTPYPALSLELELQPGEEKWITCAHAALDSHQASFDLARSLSALSWEANAARLEMLDAGQLEVYTGNADWDLAFAFSQSLAHGLFVGPTAHLPHKSFVASRQIDQGYSPRGDGSDYSHQWCGQSPLDAFYLGGLLLPGSPELLAGVLRNYLAVQEEDGSIDWKPGLAGQRSRLLATPVIAALALRVYQASRDAGFLREVLSGLVRFVEHWFSPLHDRDQDGFPEWDHPVQTGYEEQPAFSSWYDWSQGGDISKSESPALGAMLVREIDSLLDIAREIGDDQSLKEFAALRERLRVEIETTWDEEQESYLYRDRDSHASPAGELLGERVGPGQIVLGRSFPQPVRILVRIHLQEGTRPHPDIFIHGESISGQHRIEHIESDQVRWMLNLGMLTGERVYTSIERFDFQGLLADDRVIVNAADYRSTDHTQLLPLWAGIPDESRAALLVEKTITNPDRYWSESGLLACFNPAPGAESECEIVHLRLNAMIAEGLVSYGCRTEAAALFNRMMAALVQNLKREGALRPYFNAVSGLASGERNGVDALAPLSTFLEVLGVQISSPQRVHLSGFNPFPWSVTVKYRGLTVLRQKDKTVVIFPDGQAVEVVDPLPKIITQEA